MPLLLSHKRNFIEDNRFLTYDKRRKLHDGGETIASCIETLIDDLPYSSIALVEEYVWSYESKVRDALLSPGGIQNGHLLQTAYPLSQRFTFRMKRVTNDGPLVAVDAGDIFKFEDALQTQAKECIRNQPSRDYLVDFHANMFWFEYSPESRLADLQGGTHWNPFYTLTSDGLKLHAVYRVSMPKAAGEYLVSYQVTLQRKKRDLNVLLCAVDVK